MILSLVSSASARKTSANSLALRTVGAGVVTQQAASLTGRKIFDIFALTNIPCLYIFGKANI